MYCAKNGRTIEGIAKDTMEVLMKYSWPGNVRELENTIERAVVLTRESFIAPADLPEDILSLAKNAEDVSSGLRVLNIPIGRIPLKDIEKIVMEETLKQSKGNKNIASKILGISTRTLYRKMDAEECPDSDEAPQA